MRVFQLAKELGLDNRDVLARLQELKVADAKSHMSTLEDETVEQLRREWMAGALKGKVYAPPPPPPPPPKVDDIVAPVRPAKSLTSKLAEEEDKQQAAAVVVAVGPSEQAVVEPPPAPVMTQEGRPIEVAPVVLPAPPLPAVAAKAAATPPEAKKPLPEPPKPEPKTPPAEAEPAKPAPPVRTPRVKGPSIELVGERILRVHGAVVVRELAELLGMKPNAVIAELMKHNVLVSINQAIEPKVAQVVAEKHGYRFEEKPKIKQAPPTPPPPPDERPEDSVLRPAVVTFLGHVDHGKTSLMDRIRNAEVAKGESGGITQHIGAYTVERNGKRITFLDTPGHAAFTAMRARGANLTDIAVIIIAADDGVMPQTKEAISHAKAAEKVTIMVAINKIDLPGSNPTRVMQQLQGEGLQAEEWGGNVMCCPVSAITGEGVDHLLEMILLQADVLELKANPKRRAEGFVIEAQMEPGMGPTVNLLVTNGTLKVGDAVLCEQYAGRVRALVNDHGVKVNSVGPGTPVKCLGIAGVPEAGAAFKVCATDKLAREQAESKALSLKREVVSVPRKATLESLIEQLKENERLELKLILKADTQGSVEAITHALKEIQSTKVLLNIVMAGTGNITVNDVMLASASNAVIMGFHVGREPNVDRTSKHEGIEIRLHSIIYELLDQVRDAMAGLLEPHFEQRIRGKAQVRQVFQLGKRGKVAGCMMTNGFVTPKHRVRVIRGGETLYEGRIESLRHFQDEVSEVREAQECGLRLEKSMDYAEGDILEFYELEEVKQSL